MRQYQRLIVTVLLVLTPSVLVNQRAAADLNEGEVLLIYNSKDNESSQIAAAYQGAHPGVRTLDLDLDYTQFPPNSVTNPACPSCNPPLADPCVSEPPCQYDFFCCSCPTLAASIAVNKYYITPAAYEQFVRQPILNYLAAHPNAILAIVTTRGLPAAIAIGFTPSNLHNDYCIKASFENALAAVGYPQIPSSPGYYMRANPYFGQVNRSFRSFLESPSTDCSVGGQAVAGKLFLVSRLDASADESQQKDHVEVVIDMIERSQNLTINKFAGTIVVDLRENNIVGAFHDAARFMFQHNWPVFYDTGAKFLHGFHDPGASGCGGYEKAIEGQYAAAYPEFVHLTLGGNHLCNPAPTCSEEMCTGYVRYYRAHASGLFVGYESYGGINIRTPNAIPPNNHGNCLDWIAAGGSFACGNVQGPELGAPAAASAHSVVNLYEYGLSWGEAVWSGISHIGVQLTPIGDPLAKVVVLDPDLNDDFKIDSADLAFVMNDPGVDINHDGLVDEDDIEVISEVYGRDCSDYPSPGLPTLPFTCGSVFGNSCGDVNLDGVVDEEDLEIVNSFPDNTSCAECPAADVNEDGWINQTDEIIVTNNMGAPADVNHDCVVGIDDMLAVINGWGSCPPDPEPCVDATCDGVVNIDDLLVVIGNWGPVPNCP